MKNSTFEISFLNGISNNLEIECDNFNESFNMIFSMIYAGLFITYLIITVSIYNHRKVFPFNNMDISAKIFILVLILLNIVLTLSQLLIKIIKANNLNHADFEQQLKTLNRLYDGFSILKSTVFHYGIFIVLINQ